MALVNCDPKNVTYEVDDLEKEFLLTIVIGDGVQSITTFKKPDNTHVQKEGITNEPIGYGKDIVNKRIIPSVAVTYFPPELENMKIKFFINDEQITEGECKRTDDETPLFRPKITFISSS